jgi:hypothetical protein
MLDGRPMALRAQDVVVALARLLHPTMSYRDLSTDLAMSLGGVHDSMVRLRNARLAGTKGQIFAGAFQPFLLHGIRHFFPVRPGDVGEGVVTGANLASLSELDYATPEVWVWPSTRGEIRQGRTIAPLYAGAPLAALTVPGLHELLALLDVLRGEHRAAVEPAQHAISDRILAAVAT